MNERTRDLATVFAEVNVEQHAADQAHDMARAAMPGEPTPVEFMAAAGALLQGAAGLWLTMQLPEEAERYLMLDEDSFVEFSRTMYRRIAANVAAIEAERAARPGRS